MFAPIADNHFWATAFHWLATYTFDGEDIFICHGYIATQNGPAML